MPVKEIFNRMRKSNCQLCDGWGVVTVIEKNNEYAKACTCIAGNNQPLPKYQELFDKIKYPNNLELSDEENKMYRESRRTKIIPEIPVKEMPPWY